MSLAKSVAAIYFLFQKVSYVLKKAIQHLTLISCSCYWRNKGFCILEDCLLLKLCQIVLYLKLFCFLLALFLAHLFTFLLPIIFLGFMKTLWFPKVFVALFLRVGHSLHLYFSQQYMWQFLPTHEYVFIISFSSHVTKAKTHWYIYIFSLERFLIRTLFHTLVRKSSSSICLLFCQALCLQFLIFFT